MPPPSKKAFQPEKFLHQIAEAKADKMDPEAERWDEAELDAIIELVLNFQRPLISTPTRTVYDKNWFFWTF